MSIFYTHRHLIPLQVVLFFFFSALACLTPILSCHMRDIGLTQYQTALINMISAFSSICGPLFAGILAERYSKYKITLIVVMIMAGVSFTSLLFIPRVIRIPRQPVLEFDCSPSVKIEKCSNWNSCSDSLIATANRTIFQLNNCKYQCMGSPTTNSPFPLHVCFQGGEDGSMCLVYDPYSHDNDSVEFESRLVSWYYEEEHNVESVPFLMYDPELTPEYIDICIYKPMAPIMVNKKAHQDIECRPMPEGCSIKCMINLYDKGNLVKPQLCVETIGDPEFTFWTYLIIRIFADVFLLASVCLMDALTVKNINEFYGLYAKTRVWPALGMAIFAPVTGVLVDYYSSVAGRPDYSPAIFIFDGLIMIASALTIAMPLQPKSKFRNFFPPPLRMRKPKFWTFETTIVLFLVLILGTNWGFMETFLYWFYDEVGATHKMLGFTLTMAIVCSFPFLLITKNLVRNIGRGHLIIFAFFFYAIRYAGISYISSPWWILPFESMETFTLLVMWVSLVAYLQSLTPKSWRLRAQYLLIIFHFCIGRGIGSIVGGMLSELFGMRETFRGFAVVSAVVGTLFLPFYHCVLKRTRIFRSQQYPSGVILDNTWHPPDENRPNGDTTNHMNHVQEDSDLEDDDPQ